MPSRTLDEREFELINIIGAKLGVNQRDLSRHMDLSLGMTNMLIRRLITKGYIRIKQLNKHKVDYILTPKGFSEKMRKSVKYTLKTIDSIGMIKNRLSLILLDLYQKGERSFFVLGGSDLALLIEVVFRNIGAKDYHVSYLDSVPSQGFEGTLLICKENFELKQQKMKTVNLIEELAKDNVLISNVQNGNVIGT